MKQHVLAVAILVLVFDGLGSGVGGSLDQAREELRRDEYGAFAVVCKEELAAIGEKGTRPLCVRVPPTKTPPKALLIYLKKAQVPVSLQGACYPRNRAPRGMEILLEEIRRSPGPALELTVDTANHTPEPGEHLIMPLRLGIYRLTRTAEGSWVVVSYSDGMVKR